MLAWRGSSTNKNIPNKMATHDEASSTLSIESSSVLRLIQAHLAECGLHQACRAIKEESGVGAAGVCHSNFRQWAIQGQWGKILDSLRLPVSLVSCDYFPLYQTGESKHYVTRPVSLEKWQVSPAKYNYIRYVIM